MFWWDLHVNRKLTKEEESVLNKEQEETLVIIPDSVKQVLAEVAEIKRKEDERVNEEKNFMSNIRKKYKECYDLLREYSEYFKNIVDIRGLDNIDSINVNISKIKDTYYRISYHINFGCEHVMVQKSTTYGNDYRKDDAKYFNKEEFLIEFPKIFATFIKEEV